MGVVCCFVLLSWLFHSSKGVLRAGSTPAQHIDVTENRILDEQADIIHSKAMF